MLKNYFYTSLYNIFIMLAPLLVTPYLSKRLGVEAIGLYEYVAVITHVFWSVGVTGLNLYGKREIAIVKKDTTLINRRYTELICLQMIQCAVAFLFYLLYILLFCENKALFFIGALSLLGTFFDNNWFLAGIEKFNVISMKGIILKILMIVGIFVLIRNPQDLTCYLLIMFGSNILMNIVFFVFSYRYVSLERVGIGDIFSHFAKALTYYLPSIMGTLYVTIDSIILMQFSGVVSNGFYSQANKIIVLTMSFITTLGAVLMPSMAYYSHKGDYNRFSHSIYDALEILIMIAIPCVVGVWSIVDRITPWFFGAAFDGIDRLICLFIPIVLFEGLFDLVGTQMMTALGQGRRLLSINLFFILINTVLDLLLIPHYDEYGAVVSTLIAVFVKVLLVLGLGRHIMNICDVLKFMMKYSVMSFVMAVILHWLKLEVFISYSFRDSIILIVIGCCTYIGALLVTRNRFVGLLLQRMRNKVK